MLRHVALVPSNKFMPVKFAVLGCLRALADVRFCLFLLLLIMPSLSLAQVSLSVHPAKKTTKTGESGANYARTTNFVDRVTLKISAAGAGDAELSCYFVGRNPQTQSLSYFGFETQQLGSLGAGQDVVV